MSEELLDLDLIGHQLLTPRSILVIGARNSGKTSFLNFLRKSLAMPPHKHPIRLPEEQEEIERRSGTKDGFTSHYLETEFDGERVGLTLWDSEGLERNIVDIQLRGVTGFLEGKFEETLNEEMKVIRSPGVRDTHIHCTFLVLDPVRLDENIAASERAVNGNPKTSDSPVVGILDRYLDLQVLETIVGKTTVVPVVSKADTVTTAHMAYLRKAVWSSLKMTSIDPLEVLTLDQEYTSSESADEEEAQSEIHKTEANKPEATIPETTEPEATQPEAVSNGDQNQEAPEAPESETPNENGEAQITPSERSRKSTGSHAAAQNLPFSVLSPDPHSLAAGDEPVGRSFAWGFADPYNPEHCDFVKLKNSVFSNWRSELREASRVIWYENWRTSRLHRNGNAVPHRKNFGGRMGPAEGGRRTTR